MIFWWQVRLLLNWILQNGLLFPLVPFQMFSLGKGFWNDHICLFCIKRYRWRKRSIYSAFCPLVKEISTIDVISNLLKQLNLVFILLTHTVGFVLKWLKSVHYFILLHKNVPRLFANEVESNWAIISPSPQQNLK